MQAQLARHGWACDIWRSFFFGPYLKIAIFEHLKILPIFRKRLTSILLPHC